MRTRIEWEPELLQEHPVGTWVRVKVFGGWIVISTTILPKGEVSESMVFIPDPNHQWTILQPLKEEPKKTSIAEEF